MRLKRSTRQPGAFTTRDEESLSALASHAAIAIETAQLVGELRRSQDELVEQNAHLWREVENKYSSHGIIGTGPRIQQVARLIERIRDSPVSVLITGESGTGKEMVAKAIHYTSPRARRPFVALNCAALPETLVESELFGIEKGVATGVQSRVGQFEKANGGTLFLDEIGDLSLAAQAKILRVLQERVLERVGGRTPLPVDVRILAATNKDLEAEIAKRQFPRRSLLPHQGDPHSYAAAARNPRGDSAAGQPFPERILPRNRPRAPWSSRPPCVRRLAVSAWPGNVRQLRNEVMRLAACARGNTISEEDLWEGLPVQPGEEPLTAPKAPAGSSPAGAGLAQESHRRTGEAHDPAGHGRDARQPAAGRAPAGSEPPGVDQ